MGFDVQCQAYAANLRRELFDTRPGHGPSLQYGHLSETWAHTCHAEVGLRQVTIDTGSGDYRLWFSDAGKADHAYAELSNPLRHGPHEVAIDGDADRRSRQCDRR